MYFKKDKWEKYIEQNTEMKLYTMTDKQEAYLEEVISQQKMISPRKNLFNTLMNLLKQKKEK